MPPRSLLPLWSEPAPRCTFSYVCPWELVRICTNLSTPKDRAWDKDSTRGVWEVSLGKQEWGSQEGEWEGRPSEMYLESRWCCGHLGLSQSHWGASDEPHRMFPGTAAPREWEAFIHHPSSSFDWGSPQWCELPSTTSWWHLPWTEGPSTEADTKEIQKSIGSLTQDAVHPPSAEIRCAEGIWLGAAHLSATAGRGEGAFQQRPTTHASDSTHSRLGHHPLSKTLLFAPNF